MWFLFLILAIAVAGWLYLRQPQFTDPEVEQQSWQGKYYDGTFHNPVKLPVVTRDESTLTGIYKFLFASQPGARPEQPLPSRKTNLQKLDRAENVVVWMGHSSYYIQLGGQRLLVDPVFSHNASPIPGTNTAFDGSNIYQPEDIPDIDYLLITHDHWDHLDYPTVNALRPKIRNIVTPIGVGSYFRKWGFAAGSIYEGDWYSKVISTADISIHILPTQHFSGRMLKRNPTLWGSFALISGEHKLYLGGDTGYGRHFKDIYEHLGSFTLAVLETGQYNKNWPHIHMMPEDTAKAADDLHAQAVLPSHNSKFKLSRHSWHEPLDRISAASKGRSWQLLTPLMGETVELDNPEQHFPQWWRAPLQTSTASSTVSTPTEQTGKAGS